MKVEVQLINERGRAVPAKARVANPKYRGALQMNEERIGELGRIVVTAKLLSDTDGTESPVVPALHEASMLYMRGKLMRMRGFELVDGIQYGQTWEVRVA